MEQERIPTMPQTSGERIPTMPQTSGERIPTMPQTSGERIPTMPQTSGERVPTMPQNAENGHIPTMPQQNHSARKNENGLLLNGIASFQGTNGNLFTVDGTQVISADSGESQIFKAFMQDHDEVFAARILKSITPQSDPERRQTRNKVLAFLDQVSRKPDSHILPLVDYGIITIQDSQYYIEIYPFCPGGDLGRKAGTIDYQELCKKIIPSVNQALHLFHEAGFVHRDVKPDNLYEYNGTIVLGDFGITCDLREDGFAADKFKTGTLGYYAPELMLQAAITASDYYSFGQTLWTLYSGEMMYGGILRRAKSFGVDEQRNQVNVAMMNNTFYGLDEIRKEDAFFEILIRGLLQYDPTKRFDYNKVIRWLSGDRALEHEVTLSVKTETFTRSVDLFGKECWDKKEMAAVLFQNWDKAVRYLYDGYIKDFLASQNFEDARFLDGIMKKYASPPSEEITAAEYKSLGLARAIMYLDNYRSVCWKGNRFYHLQEIGQAVQNAMQERKFLSSAVELLTKNLISEWYRHQPMQNKSIQTTLDTIRKLYLKENQFAKYIAFCWLGLFAVPENKPILYQNTKNIDELVQMLLRDQHTLYQTDKKFQCLLIDQPELMAVLCMWGYQEAVLELYNQRNALPSERFYQLLTFFEMEVSEENRVLVREFYHDYGPESYLYWLQQNLDLYTFSGAICTSLKSQIASKAIEKQDSLQKQRTAFEELRTLAAELQRYYQEHNFFMAKLGLSQTTDGNYISSDKLSALWGLKFLERTVPVGFKYYLAM